jgi:hypothetical protein
VVSRGDSSRIRSPETTQASIMIETARPKPSGAGVDDDDHDHHDDHRDEDFALSGHWR